MKKLFVSQSLVEVEALKELLDGAGIPCMLKNRQGSSLAGEVPFVEVFPELWVNDEDYNEAQEIAATRSGASTATASWTCAGCGEHLSGEFTTCWKCGLERGAAPGTARRRTDSEQELAGGRSAGSDVFWAVLFGVALTLAAQWLWNYFAVERDPYDRNRDGKNDAVEEYIDRKLVGAKYDNDFDGYFETTVWYNPNGSAIRTEVDRDRDGKPDVIEYYTMGKLDSVEFIDSTTRQVRKRAFIKLDVKVREEIDEDGDGKFEKIIEFDQFENPKP